MPGSRSLAQSTADRLRRAGFTEQRPKRLGLAGSDVGQRGDVLPWHHQRVPVRDRKAAMDGVGQFVAGRDPLGRRGQKGQGLADIGADDRGGDRTWGSLRDTGPDEWR